MGELRNDCEIAFKLTGQGHLQSVGKCRLNRHSQGKIFQKVHSSSRARNPSVEPF